jgi:GDP-L-fucose synthase
MIADLAAMIQEITGYEGEVVWDTSRPDGQPTRYLDVTRARQLMGFEAEVPLAEGLRRTVDSFRAQMAPIG